MCGVQLSLRRGNSSSDINDSFMTSEPLHILERGPDWSDSLVFSVHHWTIQLLASVLHLRGQQLQRQPLSDGNIVLLWNGEIFGGINVPTLVSDTSHLFRLLTNSDTESCFQTRLFQILSRTEGPYAFAVFNRSMKKIWFGRDPLGRRSLVQAALENAFIVSSVCFPNLQDKFEEVAVQGVYSVDLQQEKFKVVEHPWNCNGLYSPYNVPWIVSGKSTEEMFYSLLKESVARRVTNIDSYHLDSSVSPVAILFSGGLDSCILAALVDQCISSEIPIDLLNIAFENPRFLKHSQSKETHASEYDIVPDRISGKKSLLELQALNKKRVWRFIELNISIDEYERHKQKIINLMYPCDSVMDLSISAPFYFCSRAKGTFEDQPFESRAKVLISGFAADELLGGYSRYRVKYEQFGEEALLQEMNLDFSRMWKRNLGRDDRILSSFGKECRYPFLDENFVRFVRSVPLSEKVDFGQPRGVGEKIILRRLAYSMGLRYCGQLAKRAIQFGAKTAKMTSAFENGTDKISVL